MCVLIKENPKYFAYIFTKTSGKEVPFTPKSLQILECLTASIGGRPSCSDIMALKTNQTLTNITDVMMCSANDVPGTFSYFSVCSSVSCIPLDFCLQADLWVFKTFMIKQCVMLTMISLTPICNRDYGEGCLACEIYWEHISGTNIFYFKNWYEWTVVYSRHLIYLN